jgi:hypothetical protein
MKTLTVKQPFASLICEGIKNIENRTWQTHFRGRILIHSSVIPIKGLPCEALTQLQYAKVFNAYEDGLNALIGENSAIVGSVEIVDCVLNHPSIWAEKTSEFMMQQRYFIYNWVLANPVLFDKPILNVKGHLSFWEYPIIDTMLNNMCKK